MSFLRVANVWSKFPGFDELTAEMNRMGEVRKKIDELEVTLAFNDFVASLLFVPSLLFSENCYLLLKKLNSGDI